MQMPIGLQAQALHSFEQSRPLVWRDKRQDLLTCRLQKSRH